MKSYQIAFLIVAGVISFGNEEGVAEAQNKDRTGTPDGSTSCSSCHNANSFNPTMSVSVEDSEGSLVTAYVPGETYRVNFDVLTFIPMPDVTGFQATALFEDLSNAGEFDNPSNNTQIENVNTLSIENRHIVEHNAPSFIGHFEVDWIAPSDGGTVRFYAAGVAANGDGENDNDHAALTTLDLTVANPSSIAEADRKYWKVRTLEHAWILEHAQLSSISTFNFMDSQGRIIHRADITQLPLQLDRASLAAGVYHLRIEGEKGIQVFSLIH
jgi:hypothetical protein